MTRPRLPNPRHPMFWASTSSIACAATYGGVQGGWIAFSVVAMLYALAYEA